MLKNYDSINVDKKIERMSIDKDFILQVINKTTSYGGKKLLRNEIEGLIHYIKEVDFNLMKHDERNVIVDKIAKNFTKQLGVRSGGMIDTHEVMKRHIGAVKNDGAQSLYRDIECPAYNTTQGVRDTNVLGVSGNTGQNVKYDMREGFNTHINKEEDSENYVDEIPENFKKLLLRDTHETTRHLENDAKPFSSITDKYPRIAKQKVQNLYLLLDSKYRNLSTDDSTFKWTVLNASNTVQGSVNTLCDQIHNIINIQFEKFNMPYVKTADNVYKKVSLFVEEFSSMSVLINSGRRYHMIFDSDIQGNQIQLSPLINDDGKFRFHTPVNIIDTITLKFQSPFTPIEFLPDRYDVKISSVNDTQSFITFNTDHKVADGELVHLEDFTTLEPIIDSTIIRKVNDEQGHIVTFMSNTILRIDMDLTTITPDTNNIVNCFIASRRVIIPVRMEYLV